MAEKDRGRERDHGFWSGVLLLGALVVGAEILLEV